MEHKRSLYKGIQLEKDFLRENNIYYNVELEYYKISNSENDTYGIEIVKKEHINNQVYKENKYIETLTKSEETVENILEKLQRNSVTPVGLEYVIEDMMW